MIDAKVRLAQNSESEIVAALVEPHFQMGGWELDFSAIFPYWLVAEIAGEVVGAVNIRISIPLSSIEMLVVKDELDGDERREVVPMLIDAAMTICAAHGASGASTMVSDENAGFLKSLEQNGYVVGNRGSTVFGRIR